MNQKQKNNVIVENLFPPQQIATCILLSCTEAGRQIDHEETEQVPRITLNQGVPFH